MCLKHRCEPAAPGTGDFGGIAAMRRATKKFSLPDGLKNLVFDVLTAPARASDKGRPQCGLMLLLEGRLDRKLVGEAIPHSGEAILEHAESFCHANRV